MPAHIFKFTFNNNKEFNVSCAINATFQIYGLLNKYFQSCLCLALEMKCHNLPNLLTEDFSSDQNDNYVCMFHVKYLNQILIPVEPQRDFCPVFLNGTLYSSFELFDHRNSNNQFIFGIYQALILCFVLTCLLLFFHTNICFVFRISLIFSPLPFSSHLLQMSAVFVVSPFSPPVCFHNQLTCVQSSPPVYRLIWSQLLHAMLMVLHCFCRLSF